MNTHASPKTPLAVPTADHTLEERTRRAHTEAMSVTSLGEGLYEVESASGHSYLVDLEAARCTCPDHVFRDVRCKHIRRVALEITAGRTPPPGRSAVECTDCERLLFVEPETQGPYYCNEHTLERGDRVVDKETGDELVVVTCSPYRADAVSVGGGETTVAEYGTNEAYDPAVPVVGAIYPYARIERNGPIPQELRVYVFPRTRLRRLVPAQQTATRAPTTDTQTVSASGRID